MGGHGKWEYGQIYEPHPEIFGGMPRAGIDLSKLNKAGQDGWELVGVVPFTTVQGEVRGAFYLFKRPAGYPMPPLRPVLAAALLLAAAGTAGAADPTPPTPGATPQRLESLLPRRCGVCHLDRAPPASPRVIPPDSGASEDFHPPDETTDLEPF